MRSVTIPPACVGRTGDISRNFSASRQFGFGWKLTEGGMTNFPVNYSVNVESSLLDFELDQKKQQRTFSSIMSDIFFGDKFINFGQEHAVRPEEFLQHEAEHPESLQHQEIPGRDVHLRGGLLWQNTLTRGDLGKSAGWNSNVNLSMNFG